jgi:phosphatidylglycerophosphatase A
LTQEKPRSVRDFSAFLLATWFGAGKLPKAPGTWGSAAAVPFAWLIALWGGPLALLAAAGLCSVVGWWASEVHSKNLDKPDPGEIVIDEVAGQWLVLAAAPLDPVFYLAGFALFRILDIWKPWPACWADRRLHGGLGIMADDILAALYGTIALLILDRWL